MSELFQTSRTNVVEHIKHIYEEGELDEISTCRNFRQVRKEGNREVTRQITKPLILIDFKSRRLFCVLWYCLHSHLDKVAKSMRKEDASMSNRKKTMLPTEIVTAVEDCGFFESIPLWAVTLIGGLFITVLSFIMIMSVYGRFFKLYLYTAIAPVPISTFAGEPSQSVGKSFIKSYAAVCLEGAIIVLACIIFSLFAASPPAVDPNAAAVSMVWSYIGELVFNMLVLVGAVKMSDRVVREMMGL